MEPLHSLSPSLTHSAISCSLWKFGQRAGAAGSRGGGRGRLQAGAPPPPQHGRRALQPVSASEQSRVTLQLSWSRSPLTILLGTLLVRRSFPWHFVWLVSREQQASSAPALSRDVDTRQDLSLTSPCLSTEDDRSSNSESQHVCRNQSSPQFFTKFI